MGMCVCGGASLMCSFGAASSNLRVLPENRDASEMPLATIMDNVAILNIFPFGMCSSMANPTVAAATAAALGRLTPMPCVPVIAGPWVPGNQEVLIGGYPSLDVKSKLMCAWAGTITVQCTGENK